MRFNLSISSVNYSTNCRTMKSSHNIERQIKLRLYYANLPLSAIDFLTNRTVKWSDPYNYYMVCFSLCDKMHTHTLDLDMKRKHPARRTPCKVAWLKNKTMSEN